MKKIVSTLLPLLLVFALLVSCAPEVPPTPDTCEHQWGSWNMTLAPTVEAEGAMTRICALCGEEESTPVAKLEPETCAHTWGEWTETLAPTVEAVGEESRTCSVCGESETRETPKLDPAPSYAYNDFTEAEKALFQEFFGLGLPFLPTNEYYVDNDYSDVLGEYINYYTLGNTQAEFEAYRAMLTGWTFVKSYEDLYGDIWYFYQCGEVALEMSYYRATPADGSEELVDYVDIYLYAATEPGNTYTDFTSSEKSLMQSVLGLVIPFVENTEYYLSQNEDSTYGTILNFYTLGNTEAEWDAYKALIASTWTFVQEYVDDYGDTCYVYTKDGVTLDMCYYEGTDGTTYIDVYAYKEDGTGSGSGGSTDTPTAGSTLTIPEAVALGNSYSHNTFSSDKYYVTGTIVEIVNTTYGNMTIKDASGNTLYIYGVYSADGTIRFDSLSSKPAVGDTITLYGVIGNYNGAQMKSGWVVSSGSGSGSGSTTPDPDPNPTPSGSASLDFGNASNRVSWDADSQIWQANGITVTNNKDGSSSAVADYTNPARFYKNSTLIVAYNGMTKIIFHVNSGKPVADFTAALDAAGANYSANGNVVTVTFASPTNSFSVVLSGGQVRLDSLEVVGEGGSTGGSGGTTPDPDPNPGTGYTYNDFTSEEKSLMQSIVGMVIPFLPNNEYYVKEHNLDYGDGTCEYGVNFYTFGNNEIEFIAYKSLFASWTNDGTDVDEYGDTWYFFSKGDIYVDLTYYYYEGVYVMDAYIYYLTTSSTGGSGSGSGSSGSTINPDNVITNDGKGLPIDSDGVYDVNLNDATYTKDVTEQGLYIDGCPTTGSPAVLVIPVEFSDVTAASKNYNIDVIKEMFEQGGNTDYYSVYDYYFLSSYGQLTLDITVLDSWFRPQYDSSYYANATMEYYGDDVAIGEQLILDEALAYLSTFMDLSKYDSDGNGVIDAVVMINTLDIDPEKSDFQWAFRYWNIYTDSEGYYYEYDGVSANDYLWASYQFIYESYDASGNTIFTDTSVRRPYTFIHEFGHVLGADDYYDTSAKTEGPLVGCDVMDAMPGDHNAFTKFNYGWLRSSRLVVADGSITLTLEAFSENGDTIIIANNWDPMLGAYQEYYILVYYTATGLNAGDDYGYFARDGVVVYHVNASLIGENYGGETYYDIYNNNTDPSDSYGTPNNLIELVKSANDTYTFVVGDTLPTITLDNGETLIYNFVVTALTEDTATVTFSRV